MRTAKITRKTRETDISITLSLDGGDVEISTGVGFFDHMLTAFAVHGGFGLKVSVQGDLHIDAHHTVEDTGIVLGQAFLSTLGDKSAINRFGSFFVPMDEALCFASCDISGRAFLVYDVPVPEVKIGEFDACLGLEFFRAFAFNAQITLHLKLEYGANAHHILEGIFKAAAHSLRLACAPSGPGILSTKGVL